MERSLGEFYEKQDSLGYDYVKDQFGLFVEGGDVYVVGLAKRSDILKKGEELKNKHNIPESNLGYKVGHLFNILLGFEISSLRKSRKDYVI